MKTTLIAIFILMIGGLVHGQELIPFKNKYSDKYGYKNAEGKEIIAPKYNSAGDFSEGLAVVNLNRKWGFIDKTGKEVIALKYDSAENFKNGKAKVYSKQYATELYIDKTGQLAK